MPDADSSHEVPQRVTKLVASSLVVALLPIAAGLGHWGGLYPAIYAVYVWVGSSIYVIGAAVVYFLYRWKGGATANAA